MNGVFQGQFKKGFLHGKVIASFQFGDKYIGEYYESQMTGYGSYTYNDGTKITGYFENGVCNRHGKKVYPDGRIYVGEFFNDVENGKGVLIKGNQKISGIWHNAILVEELVQQPVQTASEADTLVAMNILKRNRPNSNAFQEDLEAVDEKNGNLDDLVEEDEENSK